MKLLVLLSSLLILTRSLNAETFYGTTSSTNRLIVPLGQVALFDAAYGNIGGWLGSITTDGKTTGFPSFGKMDSQPAIAGPAELVITNAALIVLGRIASTNVVTRIFNSPSASTNLLISVPPTQRIRFFEPIGNIWALQAGQVAPQLLIRSSSAGLKGSIIELDGPIGIWVSQTGGVLVSYVLIDQTSIQGQAAALETSAQRTVWIDRSSNLTNWIPSALLHPEESGAEFYRLRIQK